MVIGIGRRQFISALGGAAFAWPLAARAQQAPMPVVGWIYSGTDTLTADRLANFGKGLGEYGYAVDKNLTLEYRTAEGHYDRLPAMAAELVRRRVAVLIATGGNEPALAAKAATADIPIVFSTGGDPVEAGLVVSLNRPGGNITGFSMVSSVLSAKRLSIIHQLAPGAAVIGGLVNSDYPDAAQQLRELNEAAAAIKQRFQIVSAATPSGIDSAFASLAEQRVGALLVANDPFFNDQGAQITALAAHYGIPAMYAQREFVTAGGLASYGPVLSESNVQVGRYTARILKGEKPADLPVVLADKFEFVINLKTAKSLGLTVPSSMQLLADEVIE
jgi:putative ABC transport system substrate-binding protein